ncbi:glutamyl-tRNA reductase [Cellulomonas timonensis]|uniref:glutamyl-tRNA reductase n=1 Tax=Cellulomonas timonensis TaxID=1689271 RepID=UPI000AA4ED63|nr:glutamyl-tRNA reductase [Cellulomonas timonensis]
MSLVASHHDLDLAVLERLSVATHAVGREIVSECPPVAGSVVLATCNRFELYLDVVASEHASDVRAAAAAVVSAHTGYPAEKVAAEVHARLGIDVAEHLFAVASGLESMVVGEREIAGQVRRALTAARRDGTTTSELEGLFQTASRTSRAVEADTGLGGAGRSMVSVALDLVEDGLPAWPDVRCVLVGTGSYAGASLAALKSRGCRDIHVFSPSGRALAFAEARGVHALTTRDLASALPDVDLVVACSGAAGAVLQADALAAVRGDAARPLAIVDLALRHDVDPEVRSLPGVRLGSLTTVSEHAPDEQPPPIEVARAIVHRTAADFAAGQRGRAWNPAVIEQRVRVLGPIERASRASEQGGEGAVRLRAERRRARAALHGPTVRAREAARVGDAEAFSAALAELAAVPAPELPGLTAPPRDEGLTKRTSARRA